MICVDDEVSPLQIHMPFAEGMHDGEGFFLMGSVVEFMDIHLAGGESDRLGSWSLSCMRTAPTAKSDASVVTVKGSSGSGMQRTGASVMRFFNSSKAAVVRGVQRKGVSL